MNRLFSILFLLLCGPITFNSCSDSEETKNQVIHTKACTIQITGMMCEKGCKTTIQTRINNLEGVVEGEVDYTLGKAFVIYNANSITCADIIKEIESIGDGLYGASVVEDKDIENAPIEVEESGNGSVSVSSYSFEVPDISWIFSDLL